MKSITAILLLICPAASVEYGVDVSLPAHHQRVTTNYPWLSHNSDPSLGVPVEYQDMPIQPLGDRQNFYERMIQGCIDHYGEKGKRCLENERDRIEMSLRQPQSMVNYTDTGFAKIRAPDKLFKKLTKFWNSNNQQESWRQERWPVGNTYTNHWDAPTYMLSVEDTGLRGGGYRLKQELWDAARETISEWVGQELTECSLYGVRIYTEGAVLNAHVDRLPLVSSAIINVAQDLDEPWPLEVIDHDGTAHNVTLEPGEMILYESHSIIHARPFPLKGRYMANIFVHFEPTGHSLRHHGIDLGHENEDVHEKYRDKVRQFFAGHEQDESNGLPPYIIVGSEEEINWRASHPTGYKAPSSADATFSTGSIDVHKAAQLGKFELLTALISSNQQLVNKTDANGWTPLHEGSRGGHLNVVQFLLGMGADVNLRTKDGKGGTPLYYAQRQQGEDHPVSKFLQSIGAISIEPEL